MGGIGMMSAGLIGAPGLGYAKDRFAGEAAVKESKPALYSEYEAGDGKLVPLLPQGEGSWTARSSAPCRTS